MKVGLIDYGMGNLKSVANAIEKVGHTSKIISKPEGLSEYDGLILPGVGAFPEAITTIHNQGFDQAMNDFLRLDRPFLGICLGMQLMCQSSQEGGFHKGLGWFDATVENFPIESGLRIPQMGWNQLYPEKKTNLFKNINEDLDVYFLHSYYVSANELSDVLATTVYGIKYASILKKDNICAMQFHPEKSQHVGLTLLKNYFS